MSNELVKLTNEEVLLIIKKNHPEIPEKDSMNIATNLVNTIDLENTALMHKGLAWIVDKYLDKIK